jgi:hypothetical protein
MAMATPGQKLRLLRESLQLTLRDVEAISFKIARARGNEEFSIPFSRLFGIEAKGVVPNIYRLYSLAVAYRCDFREMLQWYGVDLAGIPEDLKFGEVPATHKVESDFSTQTVRIPLDLDPAFDLAITTNVAMLVRKWGAVSCAFLEGLSKESFTYAYVGTEDYTMYPLIMPGSFLQIDESRVKIQEQGWRSEYERPVYFVETRHEGFRVGWCSICEGALTVHAHPLSSTRVKSYLYPQDAEIIGQVIAISMRLVGQERLGEGQGRKAQKEPSSVVVPIHQNGGQAREG